MARRASVKMIAISSIMILLVIGGWSAEAPGKALLDGLKQQILDSKAMSQKVKDFAIAKLLAQCSNEVFVKAAEAQNAKNVPVDQLQKIDKDWVAAEDELPIQKELKGNDCSKELKKVIAATKGLDESFVKDAQAANVGMSGLTSNYWHGDKDKWKKCFNEGKGALFVGELKFDKSSNKELQQISLPLINSQGKVIGVVIWGVEPAKLD